MLLGLSSVTQEYFHTRKHGSVVLWRIKWSDGAESTAVARNGREIVSLPGLKQGYERPEHQSDADPTKID